MLTSLPETSKGETGIGGTLMTYRAKVVELVHTCKTVIARVQPSARIAIQPLLYRLTIMPFNQPMKSMVSGLNIRASNSSSFKTKQMNRNQYQGFNYVTCVV
jgi:hypothetical protein